MVRTTINYDGVCMSVDVSGGEGVYVGVSVLRMVYGCECIGVGVVRACGVRCVALENHGVREKNGCKLQST